MYLLWFHVTFDWLQNNKHSRNLLRWSLFMGKTITVKEKQDLFFLDQQRARG